MAVSFREKNASFIVNNIPFVGVIFLSRKEAKGSSFRCLAIPIIPPGSLTCSVYSTVTRDLGLTAHPKDY